MAANRFTTPALRAAFVQWCRARGIHRPDTAAGMQVLVARFLQEMLARARPAESIGALPYGTDPLSRADKQIDLLRTDGGLVDIADPETEDSDFGEFIRQRAASMQQADGDDLAAAVIHRSADTAKLEAQAPFQRTDAPPSVTEAVLGNTVTLHFGESKQVAQWSGSDADTRPLTVTIGLIEQIWELPAGVSFGGEVRPYATLLWGSGGFSYTAEIDLCRGAQWTVNASSAFLTLTLPHSTEEPGAISIKAAGSFSYQPCVRTAPLTRTVYIQPTTGLVPVPFFAKKLTVWRTNAKAAITIQIFGMTPRDIQTLGVAAAAASAEPTSPSTILLEGDAANFSIAITPGPETTDCICIFELGI